MCRRCFVLEQDGAQLGSRSGAAVRLPFTEKNGRHSSRQGRLRRAVGKRGVMSRRGWVLFSAMCLIWGIPYLLIKVAVSELSAVDVIFGRCIVAVVLLLPVAAV